MAGRATQAEVDGVQSLLPETIARWFLPETIAASSEESNSSSSWMISYA